MRSGRFAFGLTVLSAAYGVFLLVATGLEFDWNLLGIAIYIQPLLVSAFFFVLLRRYCTRGDSRDKAIAWTAAWLYLGWTFVAGFTVAAGGMVGAVLLLAHRE